jgi:hypothetical protein
MRRKDAPCSSIFVIIVLLLSFATLAQNQLLSLQQQQQRQSSPSLPIPSLAYADKIKLKNKSLINDISDQIVNPGSSKDELQSILQQIQTQIYLIAGHDKATNAIKQIESAIELNPNGPLAQSLLFLARQQAAGNIEDSNKVITEVSRYAATNGTDRIVLLLEQPVAATTLQQQEQQQPPLSYAYRNNSIGTPQFALPMNNNKVV